jgi:hypothetical protein
MSIASCGLLVAASLAAHFHHMRLCESCMALTPLDASVAGERYRRSFRAFHWAVDHRWSMVAVTALAGLPMLFPPSFIPAPLLPTGVILASLPLTWVARRHSRLLPWCPFCRGGGGRREVSPILPPSPSPTS